MVNKLEISARIRDEFRFNWQEISGLIVAILVTAFIFSFRDWGGEQFDLLIGLKNLFLVIIITVISFLFRFSCQKIYGLAAGNKVEFKVWWMGILIALVIAFITMGRLPLIFIGGITIAFMVRHRLGEFRYGPSWRINGIAALWGIWGNLILAILFAVGLYLFPQSYFFNKGLILNLIMAGGALIPLPQLDGLMIFLSSRVFYVLGILAVLLAAILLLTGTKIGIIIAIIVGGTAGFIAIITGSEK